MEHLQEPRYVQPSRPIEFEYEREATPERLRQLRALGYQGWPIPWGYITDRQAKVMLRRLKMGEPLWQGGEEKAVPLPSPQGVLPLG